VTPRHTVVDRARRSFEHAFGYAPEFVAHAPGRVNLIGEHTDYNDGFVLPMAIGFGTAVAAGPRTDGKVAVFAADRGGASDLFDLSVPIEHRGDQPWTAHVRGIAHALIARGFGLEGMNIAIAGDVPQGAGLSSSASLGVAAAMAFARASGLATLSATDFALIAQQSENQFVGTACGIMDQLVSARAELGCALLIDCRSLDASPVRMPGDVAVAIIHSGVARELAGSAYNDRRRQCEDMARHAEVAALRDLTLSELEAAASGIDPVALRRARHVVTENARTCAAAEALAAGDLETMGALMAQSHASMRDDFEITVPKIDELVSIAQEAVGAQGGARMTGGGFGGCIVAVCAASRIADATATIATRYATPAGGPPPIYISAPAAGARYL
jgi:galactokinase